ncbi:hypothetical protein AgCh_025692 [Apium graveolens]
MILEEPALRCRALGKSLANQEVQLAAGRSTWSWKILRGIVSSLRWTSEVMEAPGWLEMIVRRRDHHHHLYRGKMFDDGRTLKNNGGNLVNEPMNGVSNQHTGRRINPSKRREAEPQHPSEENDIWRGSRREVQGEESQDQEASPTRGIEISFSYGRFADGRYKQVSGNCDYGGSCMYEEEHPKTRRYFNNKVRAHPMKVHWRYRWKVTCYTKGQAREAPPQDSWHGWARLEAPDYGVSVAIEERSYLSKLVFWTDNRHSPMEDFIIISLGKYLEPVAGSCAKKSAKSEAESGIFQKLCRRPPGMCRRPPGDPGTRLGTEAASWGRNFRIWIFIIQLLLGF